MRVDAPRSLTLTYEARSEADARAKAAIDEVRLAADGLIPISSAWRPGGVSAANVALFGVIGLAMPSNGRLTVTYGPAAGAAPPRMVATSRCAGCDRQFATVMDRCPFCGLANPASTPASDPAG